MTVELNWHEGDEHPGVAWDSDPEPLPVAKAPSQPIAQEERTETPGPRWLLRILLLSIAVVGGAALAVGGMFLWRASSGRQAARQDVEATAVLLLQAQQSGDLQLYAGLLDSTDQAWLAQRMAALREQPELALPANVAVEAVALEGKQAAAETVERYADGSAVRKLAFFRLIDGQWRLAPSRPDAFGARAQAKSTHFRIQYRKRDAAFINDLINQAEGAYVVLCGELRCPSRTRPLDLRISYDADGPASQVSGVVWVPSPWLLGIAESGRPLPQFQAELVRQLARQLARDKTADVSPALLEVIGEWAVGDVTGMARPPSQVLIEAMQASAPLPLEMAWQQVALANIGANELASAEMLSMLGFIQSTAGSDAVGRLLEALPGTLDTVVKRAFQSEMHVFQDNWIRWFDTNHPTVPATSSG